MKKHISKIGSIVFSTSVVIFSLAAAFSGTIAWFNTTKAATVSAGSFQVVNNSTAEMAPVKLVKFEYRVIDDIIDYFNPKYGSVETYEFDTEEDAFINVDEESAYQTTDVMNMFDPAGYDISGIRDLYCNVVYIIQVSGASLDNLKVYANIIDYEEPEEDGIVYINLSDYVDFDVYTTAEISAVTAPSYYPSHMHKGDPNDPEVDPMDPEPTKENEKEFYKVDYLSADENKVHANFYSANPKTDKLLLRTLNIDSDSATFYINVNYAPSQLEQYSGSLIDDRVRALLDFNFSIEL